MDILNNTLNESKELLEKELNRGLLKRENEDIMRDIISALEGYISALAEKVLLTRKKALTQLKNHLTPMLKLLISLLMTQRLSLTTCLSLLKTYSAETKKCLL